MYLKNLFILFCIIAISCKKPPQTVDYYETNQATGISQKRTGLAIGRKPINYSIDVFVKPDVPKYDVEDISPVFIGEGDLLGKKELIVKGRMVQRGKSINEKEALMEALVQKAEDLGATVLYNVNYQYFTTKDSSGYNVSGMAARYILKKK